MYHIVCKTNENQPRYSFYASVVTCDSPSIGGGTHTYLVWTASRESWSSDSETSKLWQVSYKQFIIIW